MQDQEQDCLCEEYRQVLADGNSIQSKFEQQPRKLSYLWGVVADLYVDTAKIKGFANVQYKMDQLKTILNNYDKAELKQFFEELLA